MFNRSFWRQFDYMLFGAVLILCVFSVAMLQSAVAGNETLIDLDSRQLLFIVIGFSIMFIVAFIDYRYLAPLTGLMWTFSFFLLAGLFIIGAAVFGSARWFDAGGFFIQPSELVKIIMIVILANYFARTQHQPKNLVWIGRSFLIVASIVVWILLQPNLSMSIVMFMIWFSLLFYSGLPLKYLALFAGVGLVLVAIGFQFLEPYQQERILTFLFPDPNASYGNEFNVEQAKITIGSGGLFGQGYGHGTQVQLRFLKVRHTDFIFSAIASEFGFVGTMILIAVLLFVVFRCFRIGYLATDLFGTLIAYGVGTLLFFQMAVNIGVNLNLIPVTGLTLPFVSYGGSSMLSLLLAIGFVESVSAHRHVT